MLFFILHDYLGTPIEMENTEKKWKIETQSSLAK
jgi:hypothetical protein